MYEPPKNNFDIEDLQIKINDLAKTNRLDHPTILKFLNLQQYPVYKTSLGKTIWHQAKSYINKIPGDNVSKFLSAYYYTVMADDTSKIIFLAMYLAARQKYPEMMSFQKFITNDESFRIFQSIGHPHV